MNRTEMFSDAVLAILITLLGLDLRPPPTRPDHLVGWLLGDWPVYLAYTASFMNLAAVWLGHRTSFAHLKAIDVPVTLANLWLLFNAALVPFSTAVLAQYLKGDGDSDTRAAVGFYALIGALLMASWVVFDSCIIRNPNLVDEGHVRFFRGERRKALLGIGLFALGGMVGYMSPLVASSIFLGIAIFFGLSVPRE